MAGDKYTWVPFYEELAVKLMKYKSSSSREELIEIMNRINNDFGSKYGSNGPRHFSLSGEIKDIDPFTIYNYINSWGIPKRRILIKELATIFNISSTTEDEEFNGVPGSKSQQFCFYGFDDNGINNTIPMLWKLFELSFEYTSETNSNNKKHLADLFNQCIKQQQVGITYLTQILFCVQPRFFLPIDKQTKTILHDEKFVPVSVTEYVKTNLQKKYKHKKQANEFRYNDKIDGQTYLSLCELCRAQTPPISFPELSYKAWLNNQKHPQNTVDQNISDPMESHKQMIPLNTILYGPPGTGKTYHTAIYAVSIIEKLPIGEVEKWSYDEVMEKYRKHYSDGRISFTTFHQSYGYEDFIEGIRPELSDETDNEENANAELNYHLKAGVFKEFCRKASIPVLGKAADYEINANPTIWKVSLEGTGPNTTRTECMKNGHIRIGWDEYGEKPDLNNLPVIKGWKEGLGKTVLNAFINRMKIGDIVFSCYSAYKIDAIGVITGDPEWDKNEKNKYRRIRKVKWLAQNLDYDITDINGGKSMTLAAVYALNSVTVDDVIKILQEKNVSLINAKEEQPNYVFIIDEINRGNISKIFGELITLIEPSKRSGRSECIPAILPYSQKTFSVPDNVYIIGTMNTADRSIALLDTALRRRFSFIEMLPDVNVLNDLGIGTIKVENETINVSKMLYVINKRIELLYDREHMIGHAFFTPLKENPCIAGLAEIFRNKVIPLLQEYFFEDYSKIQLVLGDNCKSQDEYKFVRDHSVDSSIFNGNPDIDVQEISYEIQESAFSLIQSYKEIGEDI
jgi:5-methylcytosine-specific restriction protein B